MIIIIIIIIIALTYIFVIKNNFLKTKRLKYQDVFRSYKEKTKAIQYVNDCIKGNLYDKNKIKNQKIQKYLL